MVDSFKNRLWLSLSGASTAACGFGLAAFFVISYFTGESLIAAASAFVIASGSAVMLGRWLAGEVVRPVEKVNLAAKSLERNPTATLPKTTGSSETDDLMRSLHRSSSQLQNLIIVMDDVAAGKTAEALRPFEDSDRLTVSFQKLVSKVTDSIDAKNELDAIRLAIARLSMDIAPVAYGNLNIEIRSDAEQTREIAEAIINLVRRLDGITRRFRESSSSAVSALAEIRNIARAAAELDAARSARFGRAFTAATHAPDRFRPIVDQFAPDSMSPAAAGSKFARALECVNDCAIRLSELRARSSEAFRKYQRLRERLIAIPKITRTAEELARRSNLIALNAAIGDSEAGRNPGPATSGEISRLSARAERLSREMEEFCKSALDEANEVDSAFAGVLSEIAELAVKSAEASEVLTRFDSLLAAYFGLPARLSDAITETGLDRERIEQILSTCRENDGSIRSAIEEGVNLINTLLGRFEDDAEFAGNPRATHTFPPTNPPAEMPESTSKPLELPRGDGDQHS